MNKLIACFFLLWSASSVWAAPSPVTSNNIAVHLFQLYADDAQPVISEALASKGAGEKVSATIIGHDISKPLLSHSRPIEVEVHGLRFNKKRKSWSANLIAVNEEEIVTAMPIAGRFEEVITLPVLKRQMRKGNTITEDDVEMRDFIVSRVRGEVVTQSGALIGQAPIRTLSAKRPVRTHEVAGPVLVKKNSMVNIRYSIPGMDISSTGKAMEDGSEGSLIAIKNLSSKKTIHGIVVDAHTITIPSKTMSRKAHAKHVNGGRHATN